MIEITFIILNAFLLGLGCAVVWHVQSVLAATKAAKRETEAVKTECVTLIATVSDAHNGLAKRLLEVEDKFKGLELKSAQRAITGTR